MTFGVDGGVSYNNNRSSVNHSKSISQDLLGKKVSLTFFLKFQFTLFMHISLVRNMGNSLFYSHIHTISSL